MSSLMTSMQCVCKDTESARRTYEVHAFERIPVGTTRAQLARLLGEWLQTHQLLQENSVFVADRLRDCMLHGRFAPPPVPTEVSMGAGRLGLAVSTHAVHGSCLVSFGTLNVSTVLEPGSTVCPAYTFSQDSSTLKSSVQGFRVECFRGGACFEISGYMFPVLPRAAFSQCFVQKQAQCTLLEDSSRLTPESCVAKQTRCRSHRDFRIKCREVHAQDQKLLALQHEDSFPLTTPLNRDISVVSTHAQAKGACMAMHTLIFKC